MVNIAPCRFLRRGDWRLYDFLRRMVSSWTRCMEYVSLIAPKVLHTVPSRDEILSLQEKTFLLPNIQGVRPTALRMRAPSVSMAALLVIICSSSLLIQHAAAHG